MAVRGVNAPGTSVPTLGRSASGGTTGRMSSARSYRLRVSQRPASKAVSHSPSRTVSISRGLLSAISRVGQASSGRPLRIQASRVFALLASQNAAFRGVPQSRRHAPVLIISGRAGRPQPSRAKPGCQHCLGRHRRSCTAARPDQCPVVMPGGKSRKSSSHSCPVSLPHLDARFHIHPSQHTLRCSD